MPESHLIRQFAGLFNSVNPYAVAPEGAQEISDNCIHRSRDVLEPRRGHSAITSAAVINAISFREGALLAMTWDDTTRGVTGQLRYYDTAFHSLPMTPGALAFDRPGGVAGQRTRFVAVNKATYFQSRYGLTKIESLSSGVCRAALQPKPDGSNGLNGSASPSIQVFNYTNGAVSNPLANGFQCAYRATLARYGANHELIESEPSPRVIASNTTGSAAYVTLQLNNPMMMPPDAFWRIWRTAQVANGTDPGDELKLVAEVLPNTTLDANGYCIRSNNVKPNDLTPDAMLVVPLYTNPVSGLGIAQANTPAPLAADMAWFKNRLLLLNTTDIQRLTIKVIGTGTGGIVDGDWISIAGVKFTFRTTPGIAGSGFFFDTKVYTAGTVAQNIENTARFLVEKINEYFYWSTIGFNGPLPSVVLGTYLSTDSTDAGQILLRSLVPGAPTFTVQTSSSAGWGSDYTTATNSDPNAQKAGLSWSAQGQPEAVPLANAAIVGDANSDGQRVIALKEAALIFKKDDGLWRWTDDGVNVALQIADPTVRLLAPETAQPLANYVIGLCEQGVQLFSENGQSVNVSHDQVERELLALVAYVGRDTLAKVAFAVSYELEHQYILCLPESSNATSCTVQYVFNLQERTWDRWKLPGVIAGAVNPTTGQLVWAIATDATAPSAAKSLWVERKAFDSTDAQDPGFSIACPVNTATATMVFAGDLTTGSQAIAVGDIIQQAQATYFLSQRVAAVTYASGANQTTVTLAAAPATAWSNAQNITILKAIQSTVKFMPFSAGAPLVTKEWGDPYLAFRFCDLDWISFDWTSEVYFGPAPAQEQITGTSSSAEPKPPIIEDSWGSAAWGAAQWDRQTRDVVLKTTLPPDVSSCALLSLKLVLANALARWELSAIDVKIAGVTQDVVR